MCEFWLKSWPFIFLFCGISKDICTDFCVSSIQDTAFDLRNGIKNHDLGERKPDLSRESAARGDTRSV